MEQGEKVVPQEDVQALATALSCFLVDRVAEGREALRRVSPATLGEVYTAGIRLGIEAHELAKGGGK